MVPEVLHAAFLVDDRAADLLVALSYDLLKLLGVHVSLLGRGLGGNGESLAQGAASLGQEAGRQGPSPLLSPYLGRALLWCFARWASSYLVPDLTLYQVRECCCQSPSDRPYQNVS